MCLTGNGPELKIAKLHIHQFLNTPLVLNLVLEGGKRKVCLKKTKPDLMRQLGEIVGFVSGFCPGQTCCTGNFWSTLAAPPFCRPQNAEVHFLFKFTFPGEWRSE